MPYDESLKSRNLSGDVKRIYSSIKKSKEFELKFCIPSEDEDGYFHKLSQCLNNIHKGNKKYNRKFQKFLKSTEFEKAIYLQVGKFLGYKDKNILTNKSTKTKIEDSIYMSMIKLDRQFQINYKKMQKWSKNQRKLFFKETYDQRKNEKPTITTFEKGKYKRSPAPLHVRDIFLKINDNLIIMPFLDTYVHISDISFPFLQNGKEKNNFNGWKETHPQSIINNILWKKVKELNQEYFIEYEADNLNVLEIIKKYSKPANINDSIVMLKKILIDKIDILSKDTVLILQETSKDHLKERYFSTRRYDQSLFTYERGKYKDKDFLRLKNFSLVTGHLWGWHRRVYGLSKSENKEGLGMLSSKRQENYSSANSKAYQNIVNYHIGKLKKIIDKKKDVNKIFFVYKWLRSELVNFYQSYYENYNENPRLFQQKKSNVTKQIANMSDKEVIQRFDVLYDDFVYQISHSNTPKEERKRIDKRIKNIKLSEEDKKMLKELRNNVEKSRRQTSEGVSKEYQIAIDEFIKYREDQIFLKKKYEILKNSKLFSDRYKKRFLLSPSYKNDGKDMEKLYLKKKEINDEIEDLEKKIKIIKNKATLSKRKKKLSEKKLEYKNVYSEIRLWLLEESINNTFDSRSKLASERLKLREIAQIKPGWFFYPDYKNTPTDVLFSLKDFYRITWDQELVDALKQLMDLMRTNSNLIKYFVDAVIDENLNEVFEEKVEFPARLSSGLKKEPLKHEFYKILDEIIKIHRYAELDKKYYGFGDSIFRVLCFVEGLSLYKGNLENNDLYNDVKTDIDNAISFYEKVLHDMIEDDSQFYQPSTYISPEDFRDNKLPEYLADGRFPAYDIGFYLTVWEIVNHLKAVQKYISLISRYDLYEIKKSVINNDCIPKQEASFLIRQNNKNACVKTKVLGKYLKDNKFPKFQNDFKYQVINKYIGIDQNKIKISAERGKNFINKESLIAWLKDRKGYRKLKQLKFFESDEPIGINYISKIEKKLHVPRKKKNIAFSFDLPNS